MKKLLITLIALSSVACTKTVKEKVYVPVHSPKVSVTEDSKQEIKEKRYITITNTLIDKRDILDGPFIELRFDKEHSKSIMYCSGAIQIQVAEPQKKIVYTKREPIVGYLLNADKYNRIKTNFINEYEKEDQYVGAYSLSPYFSCTPDFDDENLKESFVYYMKKNDYEKMDLVYELVKEKQFFKVISMIRAEGEYEKVNPEIDFDEIIRRYDLDSIIFSTKYHKHFFKQEGPGICKPRKNYFCGDVIKRKTKNGKNQLLKLSTCELEYSKKGELKRCGGSKAWDDIFNENY